MSIHSGVGLARWACLASVLAIALSLSGCSAEPAPTPQVAATPTPEAPPVVEPPRKYLPPVIGNGKPYKRTPDPDEESTEEQGSDTALLEFSASWCPPCKAMAPIVRQLQNAGYPIRQHDIDLRKKFAASLDVHSVPTFIFFVKGEEVHRFSGATSYENLVKLFKKYKIRPTKVPL